MGVTSSPIASSSSGLDMVASWSDEWHHHLILVGGAGISDTVGGEALDVGSLPAVGGCRVLAGMVASGMLLIMSCKGYISTTWASGRQAQKTAP